jgi:hypothetical protein
MKFHRIHTRDPLWEAQLAVALAIVLQLLLPDRFLGGSKFVLIIAEAILLLALVFTTPKDPVFRSLRRRVNVVALISIVGATNIYTLERLAHFLLQGGKITNGHELILAAVNIFLTNVIIFGLLYWEIDGGGPGQRRKRSLSQRDFLFPQMSDPQVAPEQWMPTFTDYLYVSATNATAFSPTDTMPLTHIVKLLMTVQATASLITIALVAARAVNILS